jgi:hypothetical protein
MEKTYTTYVLGHKTQWLGGWGGGALSSIFVLLPQVPVDRVLTGAQQTSVLEL